MRGGHEEKKEREGGSGKEARRGDNRGQTVLGHKHAGLVQNKVLL